MYSLATLDLCKDKILATASASAGSSRLEPSEDLTPHSDSGAVWCWGEAMGWLPSKPIIPLFCSNRTAVDEQNFLKCPANVSVAVTISVTRDRHLTPGIS